VWRDSSGRSTHRPSGCGTSVRAEGRVRGTVAASVGFCPDQRLSETAGPRRPWVSALRGFDRGRRRQADWLASKSGKSPSWRRSVAMSK
jgi:hypothetical protein